MGKIIATQYMFGGMVTFLETENEEKQNRIMFGSLQAFSWLVFLCCRNGHVGLREKVILEKNNICC